MVFKMNLRRLPSQHGDFSVKEVDGRPTWTDCDEAGDYVVPNVLSPRDQVFRPDMDETVPHIETPRSAMG